MSFLSLHSDPLFYIVNILVDIIFVSYSAGLIHIMFFHTLILHMHSILYASSLLDGGNSTPATMLLTPLVGMFLP